MKEYIWRSLNRMGWSLINGMVNPDGINEKLNRIVKEKRCFVDYPLIKNPSGFMIRQRG
jgi:hypothetical protein